MNHTKLIPHAKTLSYALFGITLLHGANSYAAVSQSPLSLTVGVPPNLIFTLDDSGSMREAFTPESIDGDRDTRKTRSSTYNSMYYDPTVTYKIPKRFDANGVESGAYTTSFQGAYYNGFRRQGTTDLSSSYAASWWYNPLANHSSTFTANDADYNYRQFANNPTDDFRVVSTLNLSGSNSTNINIAGLTVRVQRSTGGCSATYNSTAVSCSRSSNTYTVSLAQAFVPAYYYTFNTNATGCTGSTPSARQANDACYELRYVTATSGIGGSDERQNFAIWYSFYRNRALATMSSARLAFSELSPSIRFTWQSLNACTSLNGTDSGCGGDNRFREFQPAQRGRFFSWLDAVPFFSGTPLREALGRAGEFLKTEPAWQKSPNGTGNTSANTYACRPSYHVLMTDGIWNGNNGAPGTDFRHDNRTFTLPDGRSYAGNIRPYADATNNTLADLAMHYWATDLRPTLDNKLTSYTPFKSGDSTSDYWDPRNDPATWQHMVNFTMGLGLTRSLTSPGIAWQGSTFASASDGNGYSNLKATTNWPAAASDSSNNVYDLWHTAINSRGEFFSVDSPDAMVQAFGDILLRIADRKSTAARPAINSGQVADDTVTTVSYQSSYASDDNWSGDLKRIDKGWDSKTQAFTTLEKWSARNKMPAWDQRKILMAGGGGANNLQAFNSTNAALVSYSGTTLSAYLNRNPETGSTDSLAASRVDYLRGSRTGEGTTFRTRSGLLGDFYSSSPAVVSKARFIPSVANRLENNTAYSNFAATALSRSGRIYIGGNDGMLHGFNTVTGVEEFAFVPSAVFPKLNKLTGSNYSHEFYVEGSPVVSDVYDSEARQWRTILVGTLKAGGKSIFALDVTTPGSEKLLWQFDESSITATDRVKMGYSFSEPTIARLHTGKWAVVFGNGYEAAGNTNGKAALFVLDAIQGTLVRSLEVQGTNGIANGLSTPRVADINGDGVADYAYAGDLQGNLWRFDLLRSAGDREASAPFRVTNDVSASDFRVGYSGRPLFSATASDSTPTDQRQAITAAPSLLRHPTGTGHLVVFGTGRFFDSGDKEGDKSMAQTVYGIWDKQTTAETGTSATVTRGTLQIQRLTTGLTGSDGTTSRAARVISNNRVRWQAGANANEPAQNGWYLNLVRSDGEMVVERMTQLGNTLFFQSLVPNSDPCGDGASNWTYAINPFTGGKTAHNAFDYVTPNNGDASGIEQSGEGGLTSSISEPDGGFEMCTGQDCVKVYPDPASVGRQSWRRVDERE